MENANFCMCDKTASESNLLFFHTVFQFVTPYGIYMQQNRIENWVLDQFSKNFVILAFFDKNHHNVFNKLRFDQTMLPNQSPCMDKSVY